MLLNYANKRERLNFEKKIEKRQLTAQNNLKKQRKQQKEKLNKFLGKEKTRIDTHREALKNKIED